MQTVKKICFAASDGGHLEQIKQLLKLGASYPYFIVTEFTETTKSLSEKEKVYFHLHINRREKFVLLKLLRNIYLSFIILLKERPTHIISTGALSTFPICLLGKILGKKIIFIESFSKTNSTTLTGRLVYRFADLFIIQRETLRRFYPKAVFGGSIY